MLDRILIIDFGSQVTQLIARRVRENEVYSEIQPFNKVTFESLITFNPKGIILSGGPASVVEIQSPRVPQAVFSYGVPVLGICYGQQTMCIELGGKVEKSNNREFGRAFIDITDSCALFDGVWNKGDREQVWMSHGDRVTQLPPGFRVVGASEGSPFAAIVDDARRFYAVQFHLEVSHTPHGIQLLRNFICNIAGCQNNWTIHAFKKKAIDAIRHQVGSGRVICGLSGGVDSSVVAVLLHEAIGDQLTCVFVDHGFMRQNEANQVINTFRDCFNIKLIHRDASKFFFNKLIGKIDPEEKRKIIGTNFIKIFENEARKLGGADFLAQGTLYPDVIESISTTSGSSVTIKSHHNVGGLPDRMNIKLIEPLRELFKDEVRTLGHELGLPDKITKRHPFPGPGLAIRILGQEITKDRLNILKKADAIYLDEIQNANLYDEIWQAFVVLLPVHTVGVMGDSRSYDYACTLRAITSIDGMTADFYHFSNEFLTSVSNRIINEVNGINRVTYDITSKPPGTIEWE
ncbi:MAG: glutamine-hydrolyzing GMP synthase [Rhodospirillaceae bacterium]|jgi:GMP synthase (glutamine-hydrolysing)|nr:glutamine-hydrolyzing GMP synthase [Rhodospirillaceae bacterium]